MNTPRTRTPTMALNTALVAAMLIATQAARALEAPLAADTTLSPAQPAVNMGALPTLNVGGGASALLRFDLSTLPKATTPEKLVKATLVLYVNRIGSPGIVEAQPLRSAWAESVATAVAAPVAGGPGSGVSFPVVAAQQFVSVDLTNLARDWIRNPGGNFGMMLAPETSAPGTVAFFDSKENTATAHVARLDLTLADQGPRGATGATGANGASGPKGDKGNAGAPGTTGPAGPVNLYYESTEWTLPALTTTWRNLHCTSGYLVGGGCGHRDFNDAAYNILVHYSGPASGAPRSAYRCHATNTGLSSRVMATYVICASATSVTGP